MDIGLETLSAITVFSKYSRHIKEVQRRESWDEIVDRYENMMVRKYPAMKQEIYRFTPFIRQKQVMPSMRAIQFAGPAMEVNNARGYNCAYLPVNSIYSFSETMFLLLGGSGVGFSVQKHHVSKLPAIKKPVGEYRYLIEDSIMGWADAVKVLFKAYTSGKKRPIFDYRAIREKGSELVTAGGKAPGPDPLRICLEQIEALLRLYNEGDHFSTTDCHDIQCFIADSVRAGGIRRAAMISLFSMDDDEMIAAKSSSVISTVLSIKEVEDIVYPYRATVEQKGRIYEDVKLSRYDYEVQYESTGTLGWWACNGQRGRSNNSVSLLRGHVTPMQFTDLWERIKNSGSGEPGIYWTNDLELGTNPCCEISLKPFQFCNLCEINADTIRNQDDFNNRAAAAAFFGTLQAGFTDFHYLRPIWRKTTEKDALLGVGITGIAGGQILGLDEKEAGQAAMLMNALTAPLIGINIAARSLTIKPSGTTSCVLGCSSGIHAWFAQFYLRTMRFGKNEPVAQYMMKNHPVLCEDDVKNDDTVCVRIPIKAPDNAILRYESALHLLERVKRYSTNWVKPGHREGANTNNVSATISIRENEWEEVGQWMWDNQDVYNGLSVLPFDNGTYTQPPFEEITEERYNELVSQLHHIDLSQVIEMENTVDFGAIAACAGGACDVAA